MKKATNFIKNNSDSNNESSKKFFSEKISNILAKVGKATFIAMSLKTSAIELTPKEYQHLTIYSTKIKKKDEYDEQVSEIERYKNFCDELSILSDNKDFASFFKALIEQESRWNHNIRSHTGAIGLAQLTSSVIKDMGYGFRPEIYIERLIFLKNNNPKIFDNFPDDLRKFLLNLGSFTTVSDWAKIVSLFKKYKKTNPEVNLLLGALVLDTILDLNTTINGSEIFYKNFLTRMHNSGVNSVKIDSIYPETNSEKRLVQAVYMYNGSKSKHTLDSKKSNIYAKKPSSKIILEERDIHTIAVLENYQQQAKKYSKINTANRQNKK